MKTSLNTLIFIGALAGIILGIILGHTHLAASTTSFWLAGFGYLGQFFICLLKIIMVPLVFTSITTGIANLKDSPQAGRIWTTLIGYSLTTTALAASTGLIIMNLLKPGAGQDVHLFQDDMRNYKPPALSLHDLAHINILTIVFAAILTGIVLIFLGKKSNRIIKTLNTLLEAIMTAVKWIMYVAPLGIMGLLIKLIASQHVHLLFILGKYILVVLTTTLFHGVVTLPLILWLVTKITPLKFFAAMKEAFITAFSTSSSTATLPISLRCITENLKIDTTISRFCLPIGATLNMDGTAMYEAMAALFVANLCGIHLSLFAQITAMLTAMLASVGAPGIPSAGMVTMMMVLQAVGLPVQAVAILIAIDRPLDTIRTVVNVEGDCVGACVVQKLTKL